MTVTDNLENLSKRLRDRGHSVMADDARRLENEVVRLAKALADERASLAQHQINLEQTLTRYSELLSNRDSTITTLKERLNRARAVLSEGT
jgi:DNA repair exonuclease SbcCD ATPase subunit